MRIVVLVKEVPDTYGSRKLDLESGLADRAASDAVPDEIGERALEVALSYAGTGSVHEVVTLTMGPAGASASVRKALAMGADRAVIVTDPALVGADMTLTSEVLAAAVQKLEADIVIVGNQSTDGMGGMMASLLAERLDLPALTNLSDLTIGDTEVSGTRNVDGGVMTVAANLPAVVSVTEQLPDPRFPGFKGIMAAKKKPLDTWSLTDLGVGDDPDAARSIVVSAAARPPRGAGVKIVDEGDGAQRLAEFLADRRLI